MASFGIRTGLVWSLISRGGTQGLQFAVTVWLARLLSPAEFGVIGMLLVFSGFAQFLADAGLSSALIHKENVTAADMSTTFWLQFGAGCVLTVGFFLAAPWMADFFHAPVLRSLGRVFAIIFVLQAAGQVHGTMLRREGRFRFLAGGTLLATISSGAIAIAFAALHYGVWALAYQILISTFMTSAVQILGYRWHPRLIFDRVSARALGGYSAYLMGHGSLNYWLRNGDNLLIGRFLGQSGLGLYTRAYSLMLLPINNVSAVFGQVMFPALSRSQNDIVRFRAIYLRSLRLIAFLSFPLMAGLGLLASEVVALLFGSKWSAMVPLLQILSVVGLVQSVVFPVGWVYTALGQTKRQFHLSIILTVLFVIAMAAGIPHGVMGVTVAYAFWTAASALLNVVFADFLLGIGIGQTLSAFGRTTLSTLAMSAAVVALRTALHSNLGDFERATLLVVTGVTVFGLVSFVLRDPALVEVLELLGRRRLRRVVAA